MSERSSGAPPALRHRIRIREVHVRDHLAPLLGRSAHGAVKLDVILRGLAALPGENEIPGLVPSTVRWETLHDMARPADFYRGDDTVLKRKWVSANLAQLQQMNLIRREPVPGSRPRILLLRDDGSGRPFDDPTGNVPDSYVTVLGTIVTFGRLARWRSPQIAAYIAAMIAERFARSDVLLAEHERKLPFGGGVWYRPLSWFADEDGQRPADHVRIPFSTRTLRRGIQELKKEGLMRTARISTDPRTGKVYKNGPRILYCNGFHDVRPGRHLPARPRVTTELLALRPTQALPAPPQLNRYTDASDP